MYRAWVVARPVRTLLLRSDVAERWPPPRSSSPGRAAPPPPPYSNTAHGSLPLGPAYSRYSSFTLSTAPAPREIRGRIDGCRRGSLSGPSRRKKKPHSPVAPPRRPRAVVLDVVRVCSERLDAAGPAFASCEPGAHAPGRCAGGVSERRARTDVASCSVLFSVLFGLWLLRSPDSKGL